MLPAPHSVREMKSESLQQATLLCEEKSSSLQMRASQLVVCGRCDWDKGRSPGRREEKGKLCIESPKRPMQQSQQPIQSVLRVHLNEKPSRLRFQLSRHT